MFCAKTKHLVVLFRDTIRFSQNVSSKGEFITAFASQKLIRIKFILNKTHFSIGSINVARFRSTFVSIGLEAEINSAAP